MPTDLPTLPKPAREYFSAVNAADIERAASMFALNAIVKDEGAEISGRAAIRDWVERTTRQYAPIATPESHDRSGGVSAITALVSGNFPGSPARLTYRFEVELDQIVRLEIH